MPKIKEGIISLLNLHSAPDAKEISLSNRQSMMEQLKSLYSNDFLDVPIRIGNPKTFIAFRSRKIV